MTESHRQDRKRSAPADENAILRAKYLDYCSAQLADLLLYLTPDEIFMVAEKAARERGESSTGSYMHMVQTATAWLSTRVSLPPFEVWVEDYRADPERYEAHLMGLWESDAPAKLDG
ncbi:MAG TPA: hypothetical protein VLA43_03720 [Longimicrobiales bacterium]|nr:hypothetical protein [Longimicrobiales bacterium]